MLCPLPVFPIDTRLGPQHLSECIMFQLLARKEAICSLLNELLLCASVPSTPGAVFMGESNRGSQEPF